MNGSSTTLKDLDAIRCWLTDRLARETCQPSGAVEVHSDIRSLGLDSLIAIEIATDLSEAVGRELPPTLLWRFATVGEVATAISTGNLEGKLARCGSGHP